MSSTLWASTNLSFGCHTTVKRTLTQKPCLDYVRMDVSEELLKHLGIIQYRIRNKKTLGKSYNATREGVKHDDRLKSFYNK